MSDVLPPHAPSTGFVPVDSIRREVGDQPMDVFLKEWPLPALRFIDRGQDSGSFGRLLQSLDRGVQLLTQKIDGAEVLRFLGKVAFIEKRQGNPFPHLVSIGRSRTNDLILDLPTVSKVHGYFVEEARGWCFTDHGSTNGSWVDGKRLSAGDRVLLEDGGELRLGRQATLQFLLPPSLWELLQGRASDVLNV